MTAAAHVRRLALADADAFLALRRQALEDEPFAFAASPSDSGSVDPQFASRVLGDQAQAVFGHFAGARLSGMVGLMGSGKLKLRHRAEIWGMYVDQGERARGAGRALLAAAIAHARTWPHVLQINLGVTEVAVAARRLYESAGFRVWGREPGALRVDGRPLDQFHMVLELSPRG